MDAPEIVAADEKIAGETAPIVEWIARGFRQLERFAFAFRHFRSVDDGRLWRFRLRAGFRSDLFFRCFEGGFHRMIICQIVSAGRLPACRDRQGCLASALTKFRSVPGMLFQNFAGRKFLFALCQLFHFFHDLL